MMLLHLKRISESTWRSIRLHAVGRGHVEALESRRFPRLGWIAKPEGVLDQDGPGQEEAGKVLPTDGAAREMASRR